MKMNKYILTIYYHDIFSGKVSEFTRREIIYANSEKEARVKFLTENDSSWHIISSEQCKIKGNCAGFCEGKSQCRFLKNKKPSSPSMEK